MADLKPYHDAIHREVIAPALEALKQRILDGVVRGPVRENVSAFGRHDARSKNRNDPRDRISITPKAEDKDTLMKNNIEDDGFETIHPTLARAEILDKARDVITRDRAATHGDAEDSFARIAEAWSWWLGPRLQGSLTAYDIAQMMSLFKKVRAEKNPAHDDNGIDDVGYSAIAAEIASKPARKETNSDESDVWFA